MKEVQEFLHHLIMWSNHKEFRCLRRTTQLDLMLLPTQITALSKDLLTDPLCLIGNRNDRSDGITGFGRLISNDQRVRRIVLARYHTDSRTPDGISSLKLEVQCIADTTLYVHIPRMFLVNRD